MQNGWNTVGGSGDCPPPYFTCTVPRRIGSSPLGCHPTHRPEHSAPHGRRTPARGTDGIRRRKRQLSGRPCREWSREIFKAKALPERVHQIDAFRNLVYAFSNFATFRGPIRLRPRTVYRYWPGCSVVIRSARRGERGKLVDNLFCVAFGFRALGMDCPHSSHTSACRGGIADSLRGQPSERSVGPKGVELGGEASTQRFIFTRFSWSRSQQPWNS